MSTFTGEELRLMLEFLETLGIKNLSLDDEVETLQVGKPPHDGLMLEEKIRLLNDLRMNTIGDCTRCRLSEKRKNIVFGEGNPECELMFIGEGPGGDEDIQGRPFVGKAGQVLRSLIGKMGFKEDEVYIANIVKCRPPGNRNPHQDEIEMCIPFLKKQVEIIRPKVLILLGNIALQGLLNSQLRITSARGKFMEYQGVKVMPTFHPSYLLRNPKDKWLTWEDAVKILKYLGRDIKT